MSVEREAKLRLTLEWMRTEFANGTPPAQAHEMARPVFAHNMCEPNDSDDDDLASDGVVKPAT